MSYFDYFYISDEPGIFSNSPAMTSQESPKTSPEYLSEFASAYQTANYAYTLTELENQGKLDTAMPISSYKVIQLSDTPAGMHGFILLEAEPASTTVKIKVCFRGMQPVSDPSSFQRGLEFGGPGLNTFTEASKNIAKQLEAVTKQYEAVELEFTGHSLGGADATYAFHDFLYYHLHGFQFQNVDKVTLNSLNAPGSYSDLKTSLAHLLFENKIDSSPLDININIAVSDRDIVSQFGENPFTDITSDLATVQVCHVDKFTYDPNIAWGDFFSILPNIIYEIIDTAHSHHDIISNDPIPSLLPDFVYQYYINQTPADIEQIKAVLEYKWPITTTINIIADSANGIMQMAKIAQGVFDDFMNGENRELEEAPSGPDSDIYTEWYTEALPASQPLDCLSVIQHNSPVYDW